MERLVRFLLSKDAIEASFKLLSYLGASALIFGLAKFAFVNNGLYLFVLLLLLFAATVTQSFFYGLQTLIFPAGNALWPTVNYVDTIKYLEKCDQNKRVRIVKQIIFTGPGMFLLVSYIGLFYMLNGFIEVLIARA
jgi:hypothetical protein